MSAQIYDLEYYRDRKRREDRERDPRRSYEYSRTSMGSPSLFDSPMKHVFHMTYPVYLKIPKDIHEPTDPKPTTENPDY